MNRAPAYLCLGAWALALLAQLAVMLTLPDKVDAFGVDVTRASHALLIQQLVFVTSGLALAFCALLSVRFRLPLLLCASLLYLLHWFPWSLVASLGLTATARAIVQFATIPGLRVVSVIRDAVLPLAFVAVIGLSSWEKMHDA